MAVCRNGNVEKCRKTAVFQQKVMILWKNYNYQKFGKLHRRTFQPAVSNEELSEMFELDASVIELMQSERYILLEKNIIPEDLGMGKEKETKEKSHSKN